MEDNKQQSAFPCNWAMEVAETVDEMNLFKGLTKREYFAAMAMQGLISKERFIDGGDIEKLPKMAIDFADALLNLLNK